MSKRFAWLLGAAVVLVAIGLLVACGSSFNASSDGLLVVGSQGSGLLETFSFNVNNGRVSAIGNPPSSTSGMTCVLNGVPSAIVMDPAGAYAYAIINASPACNTSNTTSTTGIVSFKVNSDGSLAAPGSLVQFNPETVNVPPNKTEMFAAVPSTMAIDSAGKFLFVSDRSTADNAQIPNYAPGAVSVFAINNGTVTEVPGSPFFTSAMPVIASQAVMDLVDVAATPTSFPSQNAVCSNSPAPTTEFLYAADGIGNRVWAFSVLPSTGALTLVANQNNPTAAGTIPGGVAVDPCNRFAYVSNTQSNNVSGYIICSAVVKPTCPNADGSLVAISGSPFSLSANGPGPLKVDAFGKYVYVVDTLSNQLSTLQISPVNGALSVGTAVVSTGNQPRAIAIRSDDSWLFVTNFNPPSVSQYSITPATGTLAAAPPILTDNYPWGVAVK